MVRPRKRQPNRRFDKGPIFPCVHSLRLVSSWLRCAVLPTAYFGSDSAGSHHRQGERCRDDVASRRRRSGAPRPVQAAKRTRSAWMVPVVVLSRPVVPIEPATATWETNMLRHRLSGRHKTAPKAESVTAHHAKCQDGYRSDGACGGGKICDANLYRTGCRKDTDCSANQYCGRPNKSACRAAKRNTECMSRQICDNLRAAAAAAAWTPVAQADKSAINHVQSGLPRRLRLHERTNLSNRSVSRRLSPQRHGLRNGICPAKHRR